MYVEYFQLLCYVAYIFTAISLCILIQVDRMTLVYYAGLVYLDIEQTWLYYYGKLRRLVVSCTTPEIPTAVYHKTTGTFRLTYSLNGELYTLVVPEKDLCTERRYAYTDSDGVYLRFDRFAGPTGNFHGMNVTMKHLGVCMNGDLRRLDTKFVGARPVCIKHDDVLRNTIADE